MTNPIAPAICEFLPDRVRKTYRAHGDGSNLPERYFRQELTALEWFNAHAVRFVPRLLAHDEKGFWLEIEAVESVMTFLDWSRRASSNSLEPVITQLIMIDKFLYDHRINYLQCDPTSVLVDRDLRVYIIDFKHTRLGQPYRGILFDCLFPFVSTHAQTSSTGSIVRAALAVRRNEFHRYVLRRMANTWTRPIEFIRSNRA